MGENESVSMRSILRNHPLLVKLNDLAVRMAHTRMRIVYPDESGWVQCSPNGSHALPDFCQIIQSVPEGAKQCRMCHVLMTVAACSSGTSVQKCHAGAFALVCPVNPPGHEQSQAVLSSCSFTDSDRDRVWNEETSARAKKLGLDLKALKKTFFKLPVMSKAEVALANDLLSASADAIRMIFAQRHIQKQLTESKERTSAVFSTGTVITEQLRELGALAEDKGLKVSTSRKKVPAIIQVIQDTVTKRPDFHYNVGEIAAAARMTPNHFSSLFRRHSGRTFSDFVTSRRIAKAKQLLGDFTLNIGEIASKTGFDDPGYFARRFRQSEGCSPREWRERLM